MNGKLHVHLYIGKQDQVNVVASINIRGNFSLILKLKSIFVSIQNNIK